MATESVTANSRKSRPIEAAHEQDRREDGDKRDADREDGEADFAPRP